ncbi:hypothetical protein EON66_01045 [archaeon]|nr:MAG: hypothetical protein EON66_01045 [archaeon]
MFGPFMPGIPVDVPLWIALRLKDDQQCHIICPEWLQVGMLCVLMEGDTRIPYSLLRRAAQLSHGRARVCVRARQGARLRAHA